MGSANKICIVLYSRHQFEVQNTTEKWDQKITKFEYCFQDSITAFMCGHWINTSSGKSEIGWCYQQLFSLGTKSFQQKSFAWLKYFAFEPFLFTKRIRLPLNLCGFCQPLVSWSHFMLFKYSTWNDVTHFHLQYELSVLYFISHLQQISLQWGMQEVAFGAILIFNFALASISRQGMDELFFGELKTSGSSSIVIRLIQQVWLRYTAKKEFVSSYEV